MKNLFLFLVILVSFNSLSQSIWTNAITGTNPNTANPYTTGQTFNANITVSGIGRGPGITGTNANDRYNANNWNTVSIDMTAYFEFTLTPISGCEINFTSFVYLSAASGTGPTNFAIRSSVDGYAANIGAPTATGTTIDLSSGTYQNITGAITFRFYGWGALGSGGTYSINDFTFNGTTSCGAPSNTITTGAVTGAPFAVDCSNTDSGSIAFTSSGTFTAGNVYTAQLSNASGSFASPTNVGTLTSTANVGSINITIPAATASGAGYTIRVVSSNPAVTGTFSSTFTVALSGGTCVLTRPYMTSVIINSCNQTCDEGHNEIVFGNTGDYSVLGNASNIVLKYGNALNPAATYTDAFTTVPATTAAINSSAGCIVLQEGLGVTMPPHTSFVIARSTICVDALDWSSLCGSGNIYIFYSTDATWQTGGNFVNSPNGTRYFRTQFTATDASVNALDYSYNSDLLLNSDGEFVTYGTSGGSPLQYGDDDCALTPILLPSGLVFFKGHYQNSVSEFYWQTSSEQNNSHFTISHSANGKQFTVLGTVLGAGNSSELLDYRFVHSYPHSGMNYYKLQSTDYDGTTYEKGIVAIKTEFSFSFYDAQTTTIELYYESDIEIYSTDGKLIEMASDTKNIPFHKSGLFFILDKRSGITERIFIP